MAVKGEYQIHFHEKAKYGMFYIIKEYIKILVKMRNETRLESETY